MHDDLLDGRSWLAHDDVNVLPDLLAECVQRQVVHVVAEWVLDFATNERDAQDDVSREDACWDRDVS